MPTDMLCIDLTLSDAEGEAPAQLISKRRRAEPASSDSSDVVVVVQDDAKRQRLEPAGGDEALGDEELAFVGETGKTALRDFPHPRNTCCVNPFAAGVQQDNSRRCPKCFCYACDDNASKCEFWGTGLRARDHCNAHECTYWDAIREKKSRKDLLKMEFDSNDTQLVPAWLKSGGVSSLEALRLKVRNGMPSGGLPGLWARHASNSGLANSQGDRGRAAALTPPGNAAAAAAGFAGHRNSMVTPATPNIPAAALKPEAQRPTPEVPARPPASPWSEKMPHPRISAVPVQLLATLELPIRTTKGLTIKELQQRLVPTGFYKGATTRAPEYGQHICLDNIAESRWVANQHKTKSDFVHLLPLVPPCGLPVQPSKMRTCNFTVISHEAGVKPVAVAVTVERGCLLPAVSTALRAQLGSSIKATEELLFAHQHPNSGWQWIKGETARLHDGWMDGGLGLYALKVPKSALPAAPDPSAAYSTTRPAPRLAIVMHEKVLAAEQASADSDSDDSMEAYLRAMGESGRRVADKPMRFGLPQVVVLDPSWHKGGIDAEKQLRKAIVAQLNAFCRPDQLPSVNSWGFTINRHTAKDTWRVPGANGLGRLATPGAVIESDYDTPGIGKLYVHWGFEPIAPPAGFDMDAFTTTPQVQDQEAIQKLASMPQLLADWKSYQHELAMLKLMPEQVLNELKIACAAAAPPSDPKAAKNSGYKPSAIAVLSVTPADASSATGAGSSSSSSSASAAAVHVVAAAAAAASDTGKRQKQYGPDRLGILRVEVYVFKTRGPRHRLIAENYEDWNVEAVHTGRHRHSSSAVGCQLKNVMNARLLQEQDGYQLLKEINDLSKADVRGIKKLMDWVVTPERESAEQPAGLSVQMHPYQLQSLKFMLDAETADGGWRQLFWQWLPHQAQQEPSGSSAVNQLRVGPGRGVWWSPVLDRVSYSVPSAPWGGFLAEEMGLGKTVEVLGLVLSNPASPAVVSGLTDAVTGKIVSRGTLVVCAVSLVGQWCQEAQKKLAGSLKMYPYHGQNRVRDPVRLATEYDLVVTTYATLASDYGKNGSGVRNPLHKIKWHRVVFDEGHTVKNAGANHSKACVAVTADRRWICTGTPLSNDITDLLGQFGVLQMQPFSTKSWFDARVKPAFLGYGMSLVPLLYTLKHTMVRHTKAQTISGQSVLALPDKTEELVPVVLANRERATYLDVHTKAAALWASVRHFPPAAINQRLLQIMSLLLPLRRICSGGSLRPTDLALPSCLEAAAAMTSHTGAAAASAAAAAAGLGGARSVNVQEDNTLQVPEATECPICLDAFETPVMTSCHHWFCKECILGVLSASSHCPLCRASVDTSGLRAPGKDNQATPVMVKKTKRRRSSSDGNDDSGSDSDEEQEADEQQQQGQPADPNVVHCESKLKALVAELRAMRAADSSSKALVFSQYNSTLEWLKTRLPEEGFSFRTITGSMAQRQRAKAIDAFQSDPPTTVFLLSMRSGAVGINLTAASHVFLLEPCINPALEEQAIGRAWRMGQTRKVVVKRFYVKGSVEERIMDVRAMRQGHATPAAPTATADGTGSSAAAAAAALGDDDPVVRTSKGRKSIIGASAIAGNLKADRQVLKIAELDLLFRTPELDSQGSGGAGSSAAAAAAAAAAR